MEQDTTNTNKPIQPKTWWKRKEVWGAVLATTSTALQLFASPWTLAFKIGTLIGAGLTAFGISKGVQANNLTSKEGWKIGNK